VVVRWAVLDWVGLGRRWGAASYEGRGVIIRGIGIPRAYSLEDFMIMLALSRLCILMYEMPQ